jgi:glycosyltransferase involved in cell wall biosynthesis
MSMSVARRAFVALSAGNQAALAGTWRERKSEIWPGEVDLLEHRPGEPRWRAIARLVRRARRYDAIVLDGSVGARELYVDVIAAGILRRRRSGPVIVIMDSQWKLGASALDRLACRVGIRLVDGPCVHYCVLSTAEVDRFPTTWGVAPERVHFTPWPHILRPDQLDTTNGGAPTVFAGGDSLREYRPLVEAARGLELEVSIATRRADLLAGLAIPPNVRAGPVSPPEFVELLRRARVVVVPLQPTPERSSGQTTYVNAMAMGKLVVVTDCLGVRDYVEHGETGLVVPPGDAGALRGALAWAADPANEAAVQRIASRAREVARDRLDPDAYVVRVLGVARDALRDRSERRADT